MRCLHENMVLRQFTGKLMVMLQIQDATSVQYLNTLSLGRPPLAAGFDSCLLARPSRTSFVSRSPVSNPLEPSRTLSNLLEQVWDEFLEPSRTLSNPLEPSRTLSNLLEQVWESRTLSNPLEPSRTLSSRSENFASTIANPLESTDAAKIRSSHQCNTSDLLRSAGHQTICFLIILHVVNMCRQAVSDRELGCVRIALPSSSLSVHPSSFLPFSFLWGFWGAY